MLTIRPRRVRSSLFIPRPINSKRSFNQFLFLFYLKNPHRKSFSRSANRRNGESKFTACKTGSGFQVQYESNIDSVNNVFLPRSVEFKERIEGKKTSVFVPI